MSLADEPTPARQSMSLSFAPGREFTRAYSAHRSAGFGPPLRIDSCDGSVPLPEQICELDTHLQEPGTSAQANKR